MSVVWFVFVFPIVLEYLLVCLVQCACPTDPGDIPQLLYVFASTCLLFLVNRHPVFFSHMVYDLPLSLWLPLLSTVSWVHGPPSSC